MLGFVSLSLTEGFHVTSSGFEWHSHCSLLLPPHVEEEQDFFLYRYKDFVTATKVQEGLFDHGWLGFGSGGC